MAELRGVDVLQSEIEKSRDKLREYNENIKKLTGRDPSRPGVRRMLSEDGPQEDGYQGRMASRGRGRLFGLARRSIMEDTGPPVKRRIIGGAFSRLGPAPVRRIRVEREESPEEEELPHKLSVQSSVVATSREAKNRNEIMQEQTKDKEGMQRNRRMFGLLLGTLNKFKTESKTLETKDVRRKKIEDKLEQKAEKERKKFKQETKLLMEEMHLEQSKISRLEQKMEMVQEHADREAEMLKLKHFIATKAKPRIFWKPVQMTSAADNRVKDSKKFVDDLLQEGKDRLDKEILELMERENKREERIKMRLREDGLLGGDDEEEEVENTSEVKDRAELGRIVVKSTTEGGIRKSVSDKPVGGDEDEEEEEEGAKKKPRRTVVVEAEDKENSDAEEEVDEEEGEAHVKDGTDVEEDEGEVKEEVLPQSVSHQEESGTGEVDKTAENGGNKDPDHESSEEAIVEEDQGLRSEAPARKNSVDDKERRVGSEKKGHDSSDRSGQRGDKRNRRRESSDDRHRERSRERDSERGRDRRNRSGEREKKRQRHDDDRRVARRGSRDRSRRDRDEKREHKKERSRHSRRDSDSEENRVVTVKKEHEERSTGKVHRKSSKSDEDEDGDVVVKSEKDTRRKSSENREKGEGAGSLSSPVELNEVETSEKRVPG